MMEELSKNLQVVASQQQNSCITTTRKPASCSTEAIYICACARHGVRAMVTACRNTDDRSRSPIINTDPHVVSYTHTHSHSQKAHSNGC